MSDTNENTQNENATADENLQGSGGTMSFDAASSIAQAFDKLQTGGEDAPPPVDPVKVEEQKTEAAPAKEMPTADEFSKMRQRKADKPSETDSDEMPKEADSLRKWAVNTRKDWKQEKSRREELEAKVAELEKNRSVGDPEEVTRLRQMNEEYERELQVSRVEATKEFKEAVVAPMAQIRDSVGAIAAKYEVPERELFEAFSEADPSTRADKLSDIAAGMNDRDKFSLYELEQKFSRVQATREKVVNNAKLALEKIDAHRQEQAKTQQEAYAKNYGSTLDKIWGEVQEALPFFKKVDGDDGWNNELDEAQNFAKGLNVDSMNEDGKARIAIRAAMMPVVYRQMEQLYNHVKETEKALSKYQTATPKAGGGTSPSAAPKEEFEGFLEAISAKLNA